MHCSDLLDREMNAGRCVGFLAIAVTETCCQVGKTTFGNFATAGKFEIVTLPDLTPPPRPYVIAAAGVDSRTHELLFPD